MTEEEKIVNKKNDRILMDLVLVDYDTVNIVPCLRKYLTETHANMEV